MRKIKLLAIAVTILCLTAGTILADIIMEQVGVVVSNVDANGNLGHSLNLFPCAAFINTVTGNEVLIGSGTVRNHSNLPQVYVNNPKTFPQFPPSVTVFLSVYAVAANGNASLLALIHAPAP